MATAASTSVALSHRARSPIEYWHLLSLDAPTVAATWACALCTSMHVAVPVGLVVTLALGTWLFYVADRILDGIRPADQRQLRERHYFHREHRSAFVLAGVVVLSGVVSLAERCLSRQGLLDFSLVLAAAVAYFVVVHWGGAAIKRWFPKEMAVGIIFAAAVSVPAWLQLPFGVMGGSFAAVVGLLSTLFWLNCLAIESWESGSAEYFFAEGKGTPSGVGRGIVRYMAMAVMVGCLAEGSSPVQTPGAASIYVSIFLSAAVLLWLESARTGLSGLRLRIAADVALLTPLLTLALSRALAFPNSFMSLGVR